MAVGVCGQALELGLAVLAKLALESSPGGGTAQAFMGFIDLRQQLDIGLGYSEWENDGGGWSSCALSGGQMEAR
jgi:hypothetical protein